MQHQALQILLNQREQLTLELLHHSPERKYTRYVPSEHSVEKPSKKCASNPGTSLCPNAKVSKTSQLGLTRQALRVRLSLSERVPGIQN